MTKSANLLTKPDLQKYLGDTGNRCSTINNIGGGQSEEVVEVDGSASHKVNSRQIPQAAASTCSITFQSL